MSDERAVNSGVDWEAPDIATAVVFDTIIGATFTVCGTQHDTLAAIEAAVTGGDNWEFTDAGTGNRTVIVGHQLEHVVALIPVIRQPIPKLHGRKIERADYIPNN